MKLKLLLSILCLSLLLSACQKAEPEQPSGEAAPVTEEEAVDPDCAEPLEEEEEADEAPVPEESAEEESEEESTPEASLQPELNAAPAAPKQVVSISNGSQTGVTQSGSFTAGANEALILSVTSDIAGGTVDFFLFDPANNEAERFTFGSGAETKTIPLSEGTWAYNCSGFFQSGTFELSGTIQ